MYTIHTSFIMFICCVLYICAFEALFYTLSFMSGWKYKYTHTRHWCLEYNVCICIPVAPMLHIWTWACNNFKLFNLFKYCTSRISWFWIGSLLMWWLKNECRYLKYCRTPLHEEWPRHHGHKGDSEVTPKTCGAISERAQVIQVQVRAPGIGNTSHPRRLGVTRVRP